MRKVEIRSEPITLGQFLKLTGHIHTGGEAKFFLGDHVVKVNGKPENRRGKKLVYGDVVSVGGDEYKVVNAD